MISPRGFSSNIVPCVQAGAITGALIGLLALDPGFIAGTGGKWIRPDNDLASYVVALEYYLQDVWRFPLFDVPQMGYPEGGSVLLNDALPLTALAAKLLQKLFGVHTNPLGVWVLLTYVLQGAMAARLVCSVGACSTWVGIAAAVFAVANTAFLSRIIHTALSSHFLILWALAVYFDSVRTARFRRTESLVLLATTLLVNPYLFVMVLALEIATLGTLALRWQLTWRDAIITSVGFVGVAMVGIASGYRVSKSEADLMSDWGYGFFSWNPVGLLWPPTGLFGFGAQVIRDATGGQHEGEAYLGAGALSILALAVWTGRRNIFLDLRRHWLLSSLLLAFAVHALSNRIHLAGRLLVTIDLPPIAMDAAGLFRATGRFIWPLSYSLTLLPIASVFQNWRPAAAIACVLAAALQLAEAAPQIRAVRHATANPAPDLIDQPQLTAWLAAHHRLWQYPSYPCGGLNERTALWGDAAFNREFQTQWLAARAGVPTNSVYSSRARKDCAVEALWAGAPRLEDGVLYLISPGVVAKSAALTEIVESKSCMTLDWAIVCSSSWDTRQK